MTPAFPLCCEPRYEAPIRRLLDGCVDYVRERVPPQALVAVVLTGSFARGEGSVLSLSNRLKVLGDIEFFVVLASAADYRRLQATMAGWGPAAAARLGGSRLDVDLEFGPVDVGYLQRRARPSIFVHDLRHHGKVLWGPPHLLDAMPACDAAAIPREDALRLLFNRTIEQLDAYDAVDQADADGLLRIAYQRVKTVLDVAGSALAFEAAHTPLYRRRPAAFARLVAETPSLAERLPRRFAREVADAARVKLSPDESDLSVLEGGAAADHRAALRDRIVADVPAMIGLIAWELAALLRRTGSLRDLLAGYVRASPLARRARDVAKLLVNPAPPPVPRRALAWPRFVRSTPRALLYTAGALAYADLHVPQADTATIASFLPLRRDARPLDRRAQRRAIVTLWRWCVRNA